MSYLVGLVCACMQSQFGGTLYSYIVQAMKSLCLNDCKIIIFLAYIYVLKLTYVPGDCKLIKHVGRGKTT